MAAEPSGRVRASFELKRTTFPLFSLVLRTTDLGELTAALRDRLGDAAEFFDRDLVVLNLAAVSVEAGEIDFGGVVALLRSYGLQPIGVHGGNDAQMAAASRAGLAPTPEVSAAGAMARSDGRTQPARGSSRDGAEADEAGAGEAGRSDAGRTETARTESARSGPAGQPAARQAPAEAAVAAAPATVASVNTMLIDRPLRSGQRVYAQNADLVILETVNFGAEIIADGNIHVYAPLRGRAIAGARGNADARIFTTCLDPQLIAIDGIYRTIDTALPDNVAGKPAQIRREGDRLLIEPL